MQGQFHYICFNPNYHYYMYLWRHLYDKIYLFHRSRNLANKHLDGIGIGGRRVWIHCCLAHHGEVSLARTAHNLHHQQR